MPTGIVRRTRLYGYPNPQTGLQQEPIIMQTAPTTSDAAELGAVWINEAAGTAYILAQITTALGSVSYVWVSVSGGAGVFSSLTVNPGPTNLSTVGNGAVSIGNATNTGAITITAGTGNVSIVGGGNTIGIGNDAAANTVTIGSTTGAAVTTIQGGTAGVAVSTSVTGTITLGLPTMTGTITIGESTAVAGQTINIGSSAAPNLINIGSLTGAGATTISAGTGGILLLAGGNIEMGPLVSGPVASPTAAVTNNARVGQATFTGFTTAAAASQVFTITNSVATATSALFVTAANAGTNDAEMTINRINPLAGSFTVTLKNNGAAALNGNVTITWWILN